MTKSPDSAKRPIVIVGGGFAGATLAQDLERQLPKDQPVAVISMDNHLVFTPMLPEVAARTVSPLHVVVAGRELAKRTDWISGEAVDADFAARELRYRLPDGQLRTIAYSHLVFACGLAVDFGSVPGMAAHALALKSTADAFVIGNEVIGRFELASAAEDDETRRRLLTVVVIGGGFSGVEIAGHLWDLMGALCPFYPHLGNSKPKVTVIQRGDRILPELQHVSLSEFAHRKLCKNGVDVRLKTAVTEVSARAVYLNNGEQIEYGLLIGTVGNTTPGVLKDLKLPIEHSRVKTNADMSVAGLEHVWAIGDCASIVNEYNGQPSPSTAQFATRQAAQLAKNLRGVFSGQPTVPFSYRPQGLLASIGRSNGVAEIYGLRFSGPIAWFLWRNVYFWKTPSLARRFGIAIDWLMDMLFPANIVRLGAAPSGRLRREHYAAGETIYRRGDPSNALYIIENGEASVDLGDGEGSSVVIGVGDRFGTSAMEEGRAVRSTTVTARTPLDVVVLDRRGAGHLSRLLGVLGREIERFLQPRRARGSLAHILQKHPDLETLTVGSVMRKNAVLLTVDDTLRTALDRIAGDSCAIALPVVNPDQSLAGYVGRTELSSALVRELGFDASAAEFMRSPVPVLRPNERLSIAVGEVLRSGLDLLPVVGDGRVVGVFSLPEAAKLLVEAGDRHRHLSRTSAHPADTILS